MKTNTSRPSREDVLNAFAVEPDAGPAILARYVRDYPEFKAELADLSQELQQPITELAGPLSPQDQARINSAWKRHHEAVLAGRADPFAALTTSGLREVARVLGVPRLIVTAFREHKVLVDSVPQHILGRLASCLSITPGRLTQVLAAPLAPAHARSYKADEKPSVAGAVTFEQLLIDAGVPPAERAKLMAGE